MYTDPTETTERDFENEINTLENRVHRLGCEKLQIEHSKKFDKTNYRFNANINYKY